MRWWSLFLSPFILCSKRSVYARSKSVLCLSSLFVRFCCRCCFKHTWASVWPFCWCMLCICKMQPMHTAYSHTQSVILKLAKTKLMTHYHHLMKIFIHPIFSVYFPSEEKTTRNHCCIMCVCVCEWLVTDGMHKLAQSHSSTQFRKQ